jgi:hypothetical protein
MKTRRFPIRLALSLSTLLLLGACGAHHPSTSQSPANVKAKPVKGGDATLQHVEAFYARLLAIRRPDLAAAYAMPPRDETFEALSESDIATHVHDLNLMLTDLDRVATSPRSDSLRMRIRRELRQYEPDGAIRRDPLLWMDILQAAVMAPLAGNPTGGCDETHKIEIRLRAFPEALRGASVLMRNAPLPDSAAFTQRIARFEFFLRSDLTARTDACKDGKRLADFTEADTLAAASLMEFRRSLAPGE